jgi:hypothetical protein
MIMSFIPVVSQSSPHRYLVRGAIATRCCNGVGPTDSGWKRRDMAVVVSIRAVLLVVCIVLMRNELSICENDV